MPINNFDSILPPFLKMGDKIEIVASAKFVSKEDILDATEVISNYGFKIKHDSHLFVKKNVFAGTVQQRIDSLQNALDDKDTKAIFFARGGYGSIQIIDHIDFSVFEKHPKWLVGFSDITTILIHVQQQYNISCIHGPMPFNFKKTDSKSLNKLFELLTGQLKDIKVCHHNFNKVGTITGKILGGNLSVLCSLVGSQSFVNFEGDIILFIEDVDEYLYHIERMMHILNRSDLLKNLKGLIVGDMTNMMDNEIPFGKDVYELINDITKKYDYPTCFNFPIGHGGTNYPVIIGSQIELKINTSFSIIHYKI